MNPASTNSRLDPLLWCAASFVIAVVGFWWPIAAANFGPDAPDSRLGALTLFTGPFVMAAGVRAVFACRRLLRAETREEIPPVLRALGLFLTLGAVLPTVWLLFVFVLLILT